MNTAMKKGVPFDEACRFLIKLGQAAHAYGSTAARLEAYLARMTAAFGLGGVFQSTPTDIVFAFQEEGDRWQRIHVAKMPGTGLELNRLAKVGELVDAVEAGQVSLAEATARLDEIDKIPHPWGVVANAFSYAFIGSGLAVLFSLGWWDVLLATLLSLVVYAMVLLSGRFGKRTAEWLPLSSAFVAAFLAGSARVFVPELNTLMVTLAAIAVLLPGYTISLGVIELVGQHVVSGTANLMSGLVYLVKQIAGAWLGVGLAGLLFAVPAAATGAPVDAQWLWLFMPLLILGLCMVFQTAPRDLLAAGFGCAIAYGGILLGSAMVGGNLGNLIGTIIAVVFANGWAIKTRRPTSIVLVPAIILLVSGSIGFRGLAAMAAGQTAMGEQQFLQMFVVALTIAAGLLVGNTIVRPKATL
ncbi:MAG: threonine/serine exporter family protein [Thermoanaerobaculia bacterium]